MAKSIKSKDPTQKAINSLAAALDPTSVLAPPKEFNDRQRQIWADLIDSKPHEAWRKTDFYFLKMWVICLTHLETLEEDISNEGYVIENARGTAIPNPKIQAKNGYMSQWVALSMKLRLTASSRDSDEEKNAGRTQAQKTAKAAAKNLMDDDEDLLAGPQSYQ